MGAFSVIYERSNTPLEPGVLDRPMARLNHRGPDGSDVSLFDRVHMGHWHFWTTPEEVGEKQPLSLADFPFTIVFDGRIDNRDDVIQILAFAKDACHLSDAALVLYAYARWGENCFEHLVGEFALVIFDQHRGELVCARDALGNRTLFYSIDSTRLVIASEPWAVAGALGRSPVLNDVTAAHLFAYRAMLDGQTLFQGIYELLPAEVMIVSTANERKWLYWEPDLDRKIRYKSAQEYADQFRALLVQAVQCRMRSNAEVGVLMSGGFDSTSVAALAAQMSAPKPLTAISYVFDQFPECDEREHINEMRKQWGLRSIQLVCDDANPFDPKAVYIQNPNMPQEGPFRVIKERGSRTAQLEGFRVLLTGALGDELYAGGAANWLADMLSDKKFGEGIREAYSYLARFSVKQIWQMGFLQGTARRVKNFLPGGKYIHRGASAPDWLTPYAAGIMMQMTPPLTYKRSRSLLSLRSAMGASYEHSFTNHFALELRHPYRDLRLVEFILAIPAYQLYSQGKNKMILRNAMQGILPEKVRTQNISVTMADFLYRWRKSESKRLVDWVEQNKTQSWQKYVKREWLLNRLTQDRLSGQYAPVSLLVWLCHSFESWYIDIGF